MSKQPISMECPNCGGRLNIAVEMPLVSTLFEQLSQPISELHQLLTYHPSPSQLPVQVDCSDEENLAVRLGGDLWLLYTVNRWWQEEMMLSVVGVAHSESGNCKTLREDKPLQVSSCPVQFVELLALFLRNAPQGLVDNVDLSRFRTLFTPLLLAMKAYLEQIRLNADSALSALEPLLEIPMSIEEKEDVGKN